MRIDLHFRPNVVVVEPQGRLTVETESVLIESIRGLHEAGQTRLVLNLANVPAIDSCGLGTIAQAYVSTWSRGGALKLARVSPRNHRLLAVTKLETVLEVYASCEEAERSFDLTVSAARDEPFRATDAAAERSLESSAVRVGG